MFSIEESGMRFGPFKEDLCFVVENSRTHNAVQPGVQIAEFIAIRDEADGALRRVWVVEAKSSSPNPNSPLPDAAETFKAFIGEIRDKLTNALVLGVMMCLGRHAPTAAELPAGFAELQLGTVSFRLILVINGHKAGWLPPLQEALAQSLRVTSRTWGLGGDSVIVLNDDLARKQGLIA